MLIQWGLSVSLSPGENVIVTVCSTEQETAKLLATVLDGNHTAASLLARAIHQDPATIKANTDGLTVPLSPSELGIWIDPIGESRWSWSLVSVKSTNMILSKNCYVFFSLRCHQPVHRGQRGGAGGGTLVSFRSALCFGPHWGVSQEHWGACHGGHQPAIQPQGPGRWRVRIKTLKHFNYILI